MKKLLLAFAVLISATVNAQVQYGGLIRAQNNAAVVGTVGRTNDNLKVIDSALSAKIPSGLVVTAGRLQVELPAGGTGLTNTEIRATALPVSGTVGVNNFPATQPVSIVSMPSTPVTGTFFQATQPVSIASVPSHPVTNAGTFAVQATVAGTVPVSGTFFQTTQPISAAALPLPTGAAIAANQQTNAITDAQIRATALPVSGAFFQTTQPVSIAASVPVTGTFFQATQPVSLATNTPDVIDRAARLLGQVSNNGTFVTQINSSLPSGAATIGAILNTSFAATQATASALNATVIGTGVFAVQATLAAETNKVIGTVNIAAAAATVKGTQGASFLPTQDAKDAGRNQVHYYTVIPVLATATDVLQSLTGTKAGVTVAATTTPAIVTTGKILRITRIAATYISTATSGYGIVRLRFNTAGFVTITSPIAITLSIGNGSPTTVNASDSEEGSLSEGWEFAAVTGIGISVQGFAAVTPAAVGYVLVSVTGYEY